MAGGSEFTEDELVPFSASASALMLLTAADFHPMGKSLATSLENQKLIADGQVLVEKSLAAMRPDDDEPWRQSLADGDEQ